jgi:hypothetical protein
MHPRLLPTGVLLSIPLYDMVIVPLAVKCGRPISMTTRIGIGFVVQLAALLSGGRGGGLGPWGRLSLYWGCPRPRPFRPPPPPRLDNVLASHTPPFPPTTPDP